jgi:PAS domain S-box-containing protein
MVLIPKIAAQVKSALQQNPQGLSITGLVKIVKISRSTAGRYLDTLLASGQVEMRRHGMAKMYSLAHRVPLSAVLSISSEFIMQLDNHLRILYVNKPLVEFLGTTRKDLVGKNIQFSPLVSVLDELFESFLQQIKNGIDGVDWNGELFLKEQKIIIACRVTPIVFENGQKGVSVTLEDITDRKRILEALKESEEIYSRIIETANEGICILDRNLHTTFINERFTEMLGYSLEEMANHNVLDYVIDEDKAVMEAQFVTRRKGIKSCYESRLRHKDGRITWCLISGSPLLDNTGSFIGSFGMFTDITERKMAEKALQESEEKYRLIIEALPDAVSVIDKDLKVIFANSNLLSWMHILGMPNDIIGRTVLDAFPFISPIVLDEYRTVFWEGRIVVTQESSRIGDAEIVTETRMVPIKENDDTVAVVTIIRNITERKQAEEALRESENRYRSLIETTGTGYVILDLEGRVRTANKEYLRLTGRTTLDEIIGKKVTDWTAPYDLLRNEQEVEKCIQQGQVRNLEIDYQKPDGTIQPIEINASLIQSVSGQNILTVCRDITKRKKTDEDLFNSRQMLQLVLDTIPQRVFWKDLNSVYLGCNKSVAVDCGYSDPSELAGKTDYETASAETADLYRTDDQQVMKTGLPKLNYEELQIKSDGTHAWLRTAKVPLRDKDSRIIGVLGTYEDISERKQTEEILQESESFNRGLVENLPEYIIVYGQDGKILYGNPAIVKVMGFGINELIGTHVLEYVAEEYRDLVHSKLAERKEESEFSSYEINILTRDGHRRSVMVNGTQIQFLKGSATLLLLTDFTERKYAEGALQMANKKLNLLTNVTRHDIKNQISVLRGYLTLLETKHPELSLNEYLQKAEAAATRISTIIEFTKEYENIGVNAPVWHECHALIETAATQTPLGQVVVKNDIPAGVEIFADPLIARVCHNLMDNAVRHGGKITTIRFSADESGGSHLIVCEDDGNGVPAKEKENIFERGFGKNTGMGLFLAREILNITGITIRETGEPGKGARFEITVPKEAYRLVDLKMSK